MASEGKFPSSSQGPPEVSATYTPGVDNDSKYNFPPEGYPYVGSVAPPPPLERSEPLFLAGYKSLAQLVSSTACASSLYHNPIWSLGAMPTFSPFVSNVASQIPIPTAVSLVPIQPIVMLGEINVHITSSGPPLSGKYVP